MYNTKEYNDLSDVGTEFSYDANGNMLYDLDREISAIRYNYLNLPDTIQFMNGNQITHCYNAAGSKLSSRYHTRRTPTVVPVGNTVQSTAGNAWTTGTDYVGSYEYSVSGSNCSLNRIHNAEGYTLYCSAQEHYPFYFTRDHLGNTREVKVCIGNDYSETIQRTQYYPSGLPWNMAFGAGEQPYKYNGKEFIEMHGLDEYDSEARWYYPAIMRTTTMDPLAEKYYDTSPYAWCGNNPIRNVDVDGREWYEDKDGNATWRKTSDTEYTDDNGTVWKNIGTEYLLFDGSDLHYLQQQEDEDGNITGLMTSSYGAVSGRAQDDGTFSYTLESQAQKNTGPIPTGVYSINPQEIQNYSDLSNVQKAASLIGKGTFPGGTYSWGENRVWITPSSVAVTNSITGEDVTRTNMSIHGGAVPGSAGCIDLYSNAPAFFNRLSQSNSSFIRLNVLYQPYNKTQRIWRAK